MKVRKKSEKLNNENRDAVLILKNFAKEYVFFRICLEEKCRELELRLEAEKSSRVNEREESEEKLRHFEMGEVTSASEISQLK